MRLRFTLAALVVLLAGLGLYLQRAAVHAWLFNLTGEEATLGQVRALGDLALQMTRPPLDLQPDAPMAYSGVNPFGINTFLQQEVEPAKREQQVQVIADAGFHWLRQEFPWSDLEISGKGNFDDCRNGPCISAWGKYDQIVDLADRNGLEIIARLSSAPNWSRADADARGAFAPPDNFTDFADYAVAVAEHFRGRVRYFQIWNEPNGNDEWGYQPVDPEAYTRLLCETYQRLKAADPEAVVLAAALTPTTELGGFNPNGQGGTNMNDLVYLQRMYNAGAKGCFDIMSVQGYGLWSGPTDHRMDPIKINFARNLFIRDLMVRNGDEHKAIWISEMNWNAVPSGSGISPDFGQVTEDQQARYAPLAYQRLQSEWPWLGVGNFWYFKDADDHEKNQAKYYFRMADPDFTLKPVYAAMKAYTSQTPVMYPGHYQEDHWAVQWSQGWEGDLDANFEFRSARALAQNSGSLDFVFAGTDLDLIVWRYPGSSLKAQVDSGLPQAVGESSAADGARSVASIAHGLPDGQHHVVIINEAGVNYIDGFIVRRRTNYTWLAIVIIALALALMLGSAGFIWRRRKLARTHA
jgi:polysaccharide biosynthesis protein PslG